MSHVITLTPTLMNFRTVHQIKCISVVWTFVISATLVMLICSAVWWQPKSSSFKCSINHYLTIKWTHFSSVDSCCLNSGCTYCFVDHHSHHTNIWLCLTTSHHYVSLHHTYYLSHYLIIVTVRVQFTMKTCRSCPCVCLSVTLFNHHDVLLGQPH